MQVLNKPITYESSYLKFLPAIYRDDELTGELLKLFESIMAPIEHSIDNIASYFDPLITPPDFLAWLASWLDLTLDQTWPEDRRRELVRSATELYRWRGTRRGLSSYLRIYTGCEPEIYEYMPGMALGSDATMGSGSQLGSGVDWYHFTVILKIDNDSKIEDSKIRTIIEAQKPVHSTYTLKLESRNGD